jgi:hypothetical protein
VLFIDGSHAYESVKDDIILWLPKVKYLISGHDYRWPGVNQAVNELIPEIKTWEMDVWYKNLS